MAILTKTARHLGFLGACLSLGACSLIVDAESLKAERRDTTSQEDAVSQEDSEDTATPSDGTLEVGDDLIITDIGEDLPDIPEKDIPESPDIEDISEVSGDDDVVTPPDADPDVVEPPADVAPTEELIVRHTGSAGCILDYYLQSVTNCPKACDWSFTFDASASTGITSFNWNFEVTEGYGVSPTSGSGARPVVTIAMPSCGLLDPVTIGPANLLVQVSINQQTSQPFKIIPFSVRQVPKCPTGARPSCFGP